MEMVEKVQNQPRIPAELIKLQEIVEKEENDRISVLPDCLLLEILPRLYSIEDAIRTGTLSKRWKHLWTLLPTLIIKQNPEKHPLSDFVSFIDKTLAQCRQLKLKKFYLQTSEYDCRFEFQVNKWIHYAIKCNVEELSITLWDMDTGDVHQLDQHFLTSSCFTSLKLEFCTFTPTVAISWRNLRSLFINRMKLDEDLIENILSGSPQLETLVLDSCYGFSLLNITSKSVKNLVLAGYNDTDNEYDRDFIIKINAPNILSLTIEDYFLYIWNILLLDLSSLVEATIDFLIFGSMTTRKEAEEEMVKGFIPNLRHVKELKIGSRCAGVVDRLKAKGFVFPYVKLPYGWPDGN
ncbi:hypothetical protein LXL04_027402 [Taraxacum kok-saghyz]